MRQRKLHKWSESFFHEGTYWYKCIHCGMWKIYLMSKAHYSYTGTIDNLRNVKPKCITQLIKEALDENKI